MSPARFAEIYSKNRIEEMIYEAENLIKKKKLEREDIGENWPDEKVVNYQRTIDEEIFYIENDIKCFKQALEIKTTQLKGV